MISDVLNRGIKVATGKDRFQEENSMIWGRIPLASKVSAQDTGGGFYAFEHKDMAKGGPPRHIHHHQDEWFYVIKGDFLVEVGGEVFRLQAGDSAFAPRNVPHAWANVGEEPGTLLTAVSPAGTFETFIRDTTKHADVPSPEELTQTFAAHGMTVVGPPLDIA